MLYQIFVSFHHNFICSSYSQQDLTLYNYWLAVKCSLLSRHELSLKHSGFSCSTCICLNIVVSFYETFCLHGYIQSRPSAIIWTLKPESHWWDKREQTVIDEHTNHLCHTINCWYASTNCTLPWQKTNRWVGNCCTLKIHIMYSRDSSLWTQQHPDNKSLCLVWKFFDKTDQWQYLRSLVPSVWLWLIETMAEGLLWMWPCK